MRDPDRATAIASQGYVDVAETFSVEKMQEAVFNQYTIAASK
jgi:hypothetical protein